jgi:thiol-disulfide isomerase/thioredoxin
MSKLMIPRWVTTVFTTGRPWLLTALIIVFFHFTGTLGRISAFAQSVMIYTGVMDYKPTENVTPPTSFDYDFKLRNLEGKVVDASVFKGKVLFINLWATWCGPCRAEMPSIQQLYNAIDTTRVAFIMLSLDSPDKQTKVERYVKDNNFSFPVYLPHQALHKQLTVRSIPTTFIVAPDGKIKIKRSGVTNYDTEEFRVYLMGLASH